MKNLSSLLGLLFFSFGLLHAQEDNDYTPESEDWIIYDLTYVMYANAPSGVEMNAWPSGHSISVMKDLVLGKSNFSVAMGLGYTSNNFRSNVYLEVNPDGKTSFWVIDDGDLEKNKVNLKYLEVPVELRFRTRPNARENFFRIYAGLRLGWRFGGYYQYETENVDIRYHEIDSFNDWRLGTYARIGYSNFSLYGYYGLLDLYDYNYEDLEGPPIDMNGVKSMAFGLSFMF